MPFWHPWWIYSSWMLLYMSLFGCFPISLCFCWMKMKASWRWQQPCSKWVIALVINLNFKRAKHNTIQCAKIYNNIIQNIYFLSKFDLDCKCIYSFFYGYSSLYLLIHKCKLMWCVLFVCSERSACVLVYMAVKFSYLQTCICILLWLT